MKKRFTRILAAFALLVFMTPSLVAWGQTVSENDVLWTEPFTNGVSGTTFTETTSWSNYIAPTTFVQADANLLVYSSSNAMASSGEAGNMVGTNVWLKKSTTGYIQVSGIKLYNTTKVKVSWAQAKKPVTVYYQFDGVGDFVELSTCSSATAEFTSNELPVTGHTTIALKFMRGSNGDNVRIDNLTLTATEVSGGTPTCATPTFSPAAGDYYTAQSVTISTTTDGATIRYTLDGSTPTTSSSVYSTPLSISTNTTVKAIAMKEGFENSGVAEATYNFLTPSFNQDWEGTMHGWTFVSVTGEQGWSVAVTSGNHYAKMSGYASSANHENEDWCISPAFDLSEYTNPVLTFKTAKNYDGNDLVVYFSNNYDGQNLATANWQELECTLSPGENNWTFVESGNIDLSSFSGSECYIGFKYTSTTSAGATWELDDIVLAELEPSITVSEQSLSGFTYVVENGPSAAQSFTVSGENLTANISLALGNDSNYEICETEDGTYTNSLTLPQNNGAVSSTTIYVRLKSDLSINTYEGTITLTSTDADDKTVDLSGSVTEPVVDYATLPFEYGGGVLADFNSLNGTSYSLDDYSSYGDGNAPYRIKFTKTGDYLQVKCNERPGIVSIGVKMVGGANTSTITVQGSADGETFRNIEVLTISGSQNSILTLETLNAFAATDRYVRMLFTKGSNVGVGPITIAKYVAPQQYDLTVALSDNVSAIYVFDANNQNNPLIEDGAAGTTQVLSGTSIIVSPDVEEGYTLATLMVNNENVISQLDESGAYTFYMPSENVTISATAEEYVAPTPSNYVRISSLDVLTDGSKVIIAARHNATADSYYAMKNATSGKPEGTSFTSMTSGDDEVVASTITDNVNNYYWTVNVTENGYTFTNANDQMIGYSSSTNFATGENTEWTIERAEAGNNAMVPGYEGFVIKNGTTDTRAFAFNGSAFGAYATTNMNAAGYNFFLDFFVQTEVVEYEYTLTITGYTNDNEKTGYYLIASPVLANPANVEGMTTEPFDLYSFDQNGDGEGNEWLNYQAGSFMLEPGKGYLYAKKASYEGEEFNFSLTGEPYSGDGWFELDYSEGVDLPGFNLMGNPLPEEATFNTYDYFGGTYNGNPELNFLKMNPAGNGFISSTGTSITVDPMTGFFVQATREGQSLQIYNYNNNNNNNNTQASNLNIQVSRDRGNVIDNAIVNFGNASMMKKFYLSNNTTRVFIPQDNREMAIVRSAAEAEMPVSFRASENGTYTLAVEAENVEMNYLHLIDNLTGMDVDLLQTPSYTFEAKTSDYASRFRLVFKANGTNENNAETFAYFNGTNWTVSNVGDATLQVVDVTGRTVANQMINGNAELNLNQPAGVYVIRLVNGDNVKTQKVVVR